MESIRPEQPRKDYEHRVEDAYTDMVEARTFLKLAMKARMGGLRAYKMDFYSTLIGFYGLVYPKLDTKQHSKLIKKINDWDNSVKILTANDGIEAGIRLSEELQEACRLDGILK